MTDAFQSARRWWRRKIGEVHNGAKNLLDIAQQGIGNEYFAFGKRRIRARKHCEALYPASCAIQRPVENANR